MVIAIPGCRPQPQGILACQNFRNRVSPGGVEILLAGLTRAQRGVQCIEDGGLAGIQRLASLALFLKINQNFVSVRRGEIADRNNRAIAKALLRQSGAKGIDRRRPGKADVDNRTPFKINAIEQPTMGDNGGHPSRKQKKRQAKEVLGLSHPIQINLFQELHAHSDPLELDTNVDRFVPKIERFDPSKTVLLRRAVFTTPTH